MTTTPTSGAADLQKALRLAAAISNLLCSNEAAARTLAAAADELVRLHTESEMRRTALLDEMQKAALAAGQATAAPQGVAYAALPEPLEIDWPELHSHALGCGVEDRDLHNRYECAEYGWQDGVDKCAERVPEQIFDADQMHAFADATYALRASHGQAPATQHPEGDVVAYLDVGAGGYLDLGSELSEDALQQLPKGRHALVIAGTYGIDGYTSASTPQSAPARVLEDAARWHWMAEYIVGTRTDLDDELIACPTVDELRKLVDADLAARKQGEKQ